MRAEATCTEVRVELSARLDGEVDAATSAALDEHLEHCAACRSHEDALSAARRAVRTQPAEVVPDLTGAIVARIETQARRRARPEWVVRVRIGAVAAAAAALVVLGASLPLTERPPATARAELVSREVRAAARSLEAYRASFDIIERGWHPDVPERRMRADIAFEAPESVRLTIRDLTSYPDPSAWTANDVDLVADARRWWIREPSSCPTAALPSCARPAVAEERTVVRREPFDGSTRLPTDIVVPVESLGDSAGFQVLGRGEVIGRPAYRVSLPYRQGAPLVGALQAGGSWRSFHPLDVVEVWIDAGTGLPLRFRVSASGASERRRWASELGYRDPAGAILLDVRATGLQRLEDIADRLFAVPLGGIVSTGRFEPQPLAELPPDLVPSDVAGLEPYRAGVTTPGRSVASYAGGMTWLKVVATRADRVPRAYETIAEEVRLADGTYGYYEPAGDATKRRVHLYSRVAHVYVESNLSRTELLEVAASLDVPGRRLPARSVGPGGRVVERLDVERAYAAVRFGRAPSYLPPGYRAVAAFKTTSPDGTETLKVHYSRAHSEYLDSGIEVTAWAPAEVLPPTAEDLEAVTVAGMRARWSPERGELEWIDDGVYRAVAAPALGQDIALRIARGLE